MFKRKGEFKAFEKKIWLASPTMHGPELEYVKEAYETNWMSMYKSFIKRIFDRVFSEGTLIVVSPVLLYLLIVI